MYTGIILLVLFVGIIFIVISVQYLLFKKSLADQNSITGDWNKFLKADAKNDIQGILFYGDKLIWNKHLKQDQLTKITEVVNSKIKKYPDLEPLKLDAYNKQIHYDRILPGIGSSGGIKQSWSE